MNRETLQLLRDAGVGADIDWRDVIVLYNYAPVPRPEVSEVLLWNRGFNLVILRGRSPEHFVKCRPVSDDVLVWETQVRAAVAGDRPEGVSVAPVRTASSDRMLIQVSPFLRGPHYGRIAPAQSAEEYERTLLIVLTGAREMADLALRAIPSLRGGLATQSLTSAATAYLDDVTPLAHFSDYERGAIVRVLHEAGDVPVRPQHGDFWWQNLIQVDGHLWAIDFDSYGTVRVPLFDDMTLVLTTLALRASGTIEGLEALVGDTDEGRRARAVLAYRAEQEGIRRDQLSALLLFYLLNMASTVHRRGGAGFSAPHVAVCRHAVERLVAGKHLLG